MKDIYVIQPYEVGSRKYKSLAMIIPSKVSRKCGINVSSVFNLRVDKIRNQIHLYGPNNTLNSSDNTPNVANKLIPDNPQNQPSPRKRLQGKI